MAVSIHALLAECDQLIISLLLIATCFNPRTPCGVRPFKEGLCALTNPFQSTHSLRSATINLQKPVMVSNVSIHALLAECDSRPWAFLPSARSFNPRTPCGVRPYIQEVKTKAELFQSTHSLRSATRKRVEEIARRLVSIHALLAECDSCAVLKIAVSHCFNPRTPCGVRQTSQ